MPNKINRELARLFKLGDKFDDALVREYEKKLIQLYKESLGNIKAQIAKMYEKYGDKVTLQEMVKFQRLTNVEKFIKEQLTKLGNATNTQIKGAIISSIDQSYTFPGFVMENVTQIKLGFTHANDNLIKATLYNPMDRIKWPTRNKKNIARMFDTIKGNITQGLIEGKGYGNTARLVQKTMNNSLYQATRIVWTETHRAQNAGRLAGLLKTQSAAERLGLVMVKVWVSTLDSRTRDSHAEIDGQKAEDDLFTFPSGTTTEGPGLSGIAEEDINCRCTVSTEFEGEIKGLLGLKKSGEIPGNFNEWTKSRLN